MTQNSVVVIDGSNIATEGRSLPSLAQLDEAVRSFLEEYPHDQFIVVVDATFEHRIDPSERQMYDEALAANELLTPPAGTIGRGDAFILAIAEKANATVFSNDSFQEFHGEYDWLFDEGRLIGGKPVPVIGWVFTARTPVRGQKSRQATRAASRKRVRGGETASAKSASRSSPRRSASSPAANLPMPTPKVPPPGAARGRGRDERAQPGGGGRDRGDRARRGGRKRGGAASPEPVNDGLAFVTFISDHAVGETVEGEVTEFSSHGAYVSVGEARCYVPLKYLGDPPPRAARDVLERGEVRAFVVQAIDGPRRAVDLALPGFEQLDGVTDRAEGIDEDDAQPATGRAGTKASGDGDEALKRRTRARVAPADGDDDQPVRRRRFKKAAAPAEPEEAAAPEPAAEPAPRRRTRKAAAPAVEVAAPEDEAPKPRRRTRKAAPEPVEEAAASDSTEPPVEPAPRRRARRAAPVESAPQADEAPARRRARRGADAPPSDTPADDAPAGPPRGRGRRVAATAPADAAPPPEAPASDAPAKRTAKRAAKKAPATEVPTSSAPAKKAAARKAAPAQAKRARSAKSEAPKSEAAPPEKRPAKRAPAKRASKKTTDADDAKASEGDAKVARKRAPSRSRSAPSDDT
ncbi:MAG: S1 RNA-binding domain-containing protein [Acidimicrobiales bacterium]